MSAIYQVGCERCDPEPASGASPTGWRGCDRWLEVETAGGAREIVPSQGEGAFFERLGTTRREAAAAGRLFGVNALLCSACGHVNERRSPAGSGLLWTALAILLLVALIAVFGLRLMPAFPGRTPILAGLVVLLALAAATRALLRRRRLARETCDGCRGRGLVEMSRADRVATRCARCGGQTVRCRFVLTT